MLHRFLKNATHIGISQNRMEGEHDATMRALLSVSDKNGIVDLARALHDRDIEIVSTGGTADVISESGIPVTHVADVTGFPEMLDGRVKTLHPAIHGGLLARLESPEHRRQLDEAGISPISILVSNLYPFEQAVRSSWSGPEEVIEQIDIGGPAMVRAGAKNFDHVFVITDPSDYPDLLNVLDAEERDQQTFSMAMAAKAFSHVSTYDSLVAAWLRSDVPPFPAEFTIGLRHHSTLRYGENPHQEAAAYRRLLAGGTEIGMLDAELTAGPAMSFNNYLDADAAWVAVQQFLKPAVAIVKHMVPCGLAVRAELSDAYKAAFEGDSVSAFGGIVALNRTLDVATATLMHKIKLDVIIAPDYDEGAIAILLKKKGSRILKLPNRFMNDALGWNLDVRPISGGILLQEPDIAQDDDDQWWIVTNAMPTDDQWEDLGFAWKAARLVKSNAIVFAKDSAIVGLGGGQPNRLESVAIAARKAGRKAEGAVMASDAFFPFADGVQAAIDAGVSAIIQPGGSIRDDDVIQAANDAGIPMIFTGTRHFRH